MSNEMISYQLEGTREVIEALDALNYKELVKIIRNVERKSLSRNTIPQIKPVVGSYHQNVNPRVGIEFAGGTMFKAGVIIDKRESGDRVPDAVLVRWFDKGTVVRQTKKGYNRGQITGQHRVQNAILSSVTGVINFFNEDFGIEVDKILSRKLAKISKAQ